MAIISFFILFDINAFLKYPPDFWLLLMCTTHLGTSIVHLEIDNTTVILTELMKPDCVSLRVTSSFSTTVSVHLNRASTLAATYILKKRKT